MRNICFFHTFFYFTFYVAFVQRTSSCKMINERKKTATIKKYGAHPKVRALKFLFQSLRGGDPSLTIYVSFSREINCER